MLVVAEMALQPCAEQEEVWGEDRLQGRFPGVLASLLPFSSALIYPWFFFFFSFFLQSLSNPCLSFCFHCLAQLSSKLTSSFVFQLWL